MSGGWCAVCGGEMGLQLAEAKLAEYRSWSPSRADAMEALAAARRECDVLRMALENLSAHLDFSEPCEAGDLGILDPSGINAAFAQALKALAAPAAAAGEEGKR